MSAPRMLLIKPRWMTRRGLADRLTTLRKEHPEAQITLLADAQPDGADLEWIPLPDLWRDPRPVILKTIQQLRRTRYDQVVILTDPHGGDLGGRELRLWAFAARARVRKIESGEPLHLLDPVLFRALAAAPVRMLLNLRARFGRPPARPSAARREALLERFVYLDQCARQLRPQKGRYLELDCGAGWGLEAAARQGWEAAGVERDSALAKTARERGLDVRNGDLAALAEGERFGFIRIIADTQELGDGLAPVARLLEPGGVLLLQVPWDVPESPPPMTPILVEALKQKTFQVPWNDRLRLVSAQVSLTMGDMVDAWFVQEGAEP